MKLEDIIKQYGVPDPSIVGKLPRGGITLDFVGHAEINRILIDIDVNVELVACRVRERQTSNQRNKRHGNNVGVSHDPRQNNARSRFGAGRQT
jgi:hypothetical protein